VVAGGTLETGQVSSHRQPQLVSERHHVIGRVGRQAGEGHHDQTLRLQAPAAKARNLPGAADEYVSRARLRWTSKPTAVDAGSCGQESQR
jgi:hypothetical protein